MSKPTKRTNKARAGVVLLSVLTLVGTGAVAWGHGSPSASIPDGEGTIHACFSNGATKTLRVVAPTQTCSSSQGGVDWPANGVLTNLTESAPVSVNFAGTPFGTAVITCGTKQAIGVVYQSPAPASPIVLTGISRGGTPTGTELTVTLYNLAGGAPNIPVRALCVTAFAQ